MPYTLLASTEQSSGLSMLGLDLQSFIFQLVTFLIVLVILKKFVFSKIMQVLEARRQAVDESLKAAKAAADSVSAAELERESVLKAARKSADEILATAQKSAVQSAKSIEEKARKSADEMYEGAKTQLLIESEAIRRELRQETASLVATATEKVINKKLTAKEADALISSNIKELG